MKHLYYLMLVVFVALMLAFAKDARGDAEELVPYAVRATAYFHLPEHLPQVRLVLSEQLKHPLWVGACSPATHTITIRKSYWDAASEVSRIFLMVHEVGHCVLGLDHSNDPNDIMYAENSMDDNYKMRVLWKLITRDGK